MYEVTPITQSSTSIAIADAKFGINVGITAMNSTSSFFFIIFTIILENSVVGGLYLGKNHSWDIGYTR